MTQSYTDFTQTMLKEVLPMVKGLIEKEEAQLVKLKAHLKKITTVNKIFFNILIPFNKEQVALISGFIQESEKYLTHYQRRQKEYEDYVLKNWD